LDLKVLEQFGAVVQNDAPLSDFTTFRLGGTCPAMVSCQTPDQIERTVQFLVSEKLPFLVIGSGSNIVVSDHGIDPYVVRYVSEKPIIERDGNDLIVSGGTLLDVLAQYAGEQGLEGLSDMNWIPGTVAGAVVGNAGAFGKQVGDVVKMVQALDAKGRKKELKASQLGFSYRYSDLKKTRDIVVSVRFSLWPGDKNTLQNRRDEVLKIRREKHPDLAVYPCAGSFFRNIEPTSKAGKREAAGWFLEQAGALRMNAGGARVFARHANMIYKSQGCRAQDVHDLSLLMAQAVKEKFGLDLVREVSFIGKFDGMPKNIKNIIW
jgi:UDP-N-acetylmuramate dehydrogenase